MASRGSGSRRRGHLPWSELAQRLLYDGHVHDLLNDFGKEVVIADIRGWIEARLPKA